jgi:hypothetical protein
VSENNHEVMPVTKMEDMPANLEAVIERPGSVMPAAFAQLEHFYGRALNGEPCICGSGKEFRSCCRDLWRAAHRAWRNRADIEREEQKQKIKEDLKQVESDEKSATEGTPICQLVATKDGGVSLRIFGDKTGPFHPVFVLSTLVEAWTNLLLKVSVGEATAHAQKMIGAVMQSTVGPQKTVMG